MQRSSTPWVALVLVACSVDFHVDQREYERRLCVLEAGPCNALEGGLSDGSSAGGAGGGAGGRISSGGSGGLAGGGNGGLAGGAGGVAAGGLGGTGATDAGPCTSGEKRCGTGGAESCVNSVWVTTLCVAPNTECEAGQCVPCVSGTKRCIGGVPSLCTAGAWQAGSACSSAEICEGGLCRTPPSCNGLAATCGQSGSDSCCTTLDVPGGTFFRNNDRTLPATVSGLLLDKYEITVGRFRKFVTAYATAQPAAGAGAHPKIAGSGWNSLWDVYLPINAGLLAAALKCNGYATWTDAPGTNENRPINCMDWFAAFAFCAWDGGRLPTDTEFNFAQTGGDQQRLYPWGNTAPAFDATLAVYDCYYGGTGSSCPGYFLQIAPVGSAPAGHGLWGQLDLAGNLDEWTIDQSESGYTVPCTDCAVLSSTDGVRAQRGGYFSDPASGLLNSSRDGSLASYEGSTSGARCARLP